MWATICLELSLAAGVKVGNCPKRFPENTRWSTDGWPELRSLPWELQTTHRDMPDNLANEAALALALALPKRQVLQGPVVRHFHVHISDTAKHGANT